MNEAHQRRAIEEHEAKYSSHLAIAGRTTDYNAARYHQRKAIEHKGLADWYRKKLEGAMSCV